MNLKLFESLSHYQNIQKPIKKLKESNVNKVEEAGVDKVDETKSMMKSLNITHIGTSDEHIFIGYGCYYGYANVTHETLGEFFMSFRVSSKRYSVIPDGSPWEFLTKEEPNSEEIIKFISENQEALDKLVKIADNKVSIDLNESANNGDEPIVYMNTWKNYNEYGADLTMYGDIDGWMTPEQAKQFAEEHNEDEPFINDTDNVPWTVSEYDDVMSTLNNIERYSQADNKDALLAIIELHVNSSTSSDLDNAFEIYENGDYTFFSGVDNAEDLGRAYVDMVGGLEGVTNSENYIDTEAYRESWKEAAEDSVREDFPELEDEDYDEFESKVAERAKDFADEQLQVDLKDGNDLSKYFDYEVFGNDLEFEGFFIASTGAIQTY